MAATYGTLLCLCLLVVGVFSQGPESNRRFFWPMPQSYVSTADTTLILDRTLIKIVSIGAQSDVLNGAIERYLPLLFPAATDTSKSPFVRTAKSSTLNEITINVQSSDLSLHSGVDESYSLIINDSPVSTITSQTVWGALHALETLSQLCQNIGVNEAYIYGVPITINDEPRFVHRGLLVDSSRNFLTKEALYRTMDAMAYSKMNVLHWHLIDSQSFPYEVYSFERLSYGAYSRNEKYRAQDISDIVTYGYMRGIRVIPEFDSPGHAYQGWKEYANVTVCGDFKPYTEYCLEPPCGQLNPSTELTYSILDGLISQAATDFPDAYVHLGFDEVNENCFLSSPELVAWMQSRGITTIPLLLQYHLDRVLSITSRFSKVPVFWQEVFDLGLTLPSSSVLQIWNQPSSLVPILRAGYNAILSNYDALYLDVGFGNWLTGGDLSWSGYNNWRTIYLNEPVPDELADDPEAIQRLLGGEVCSWGESVDSVALDGRIWPRAAAAAERWWSAKDVCDVADAVERLSRHRERLVVRGISASALRPKWCNQNPESCDVNERVSKSKH